jgi:ABC-2 type transport system ATP-binding protein
MIQDAMIRTVDLRVDYDDVAAVRDMNLAIPAGEVFGLIGPNGAGKSSTIRVLATLQEPTYGEVQVGGFDVAEAPEKVHEILGYMPDLAPVEDGLRCWEFLELHAGAYGLPRAERLDKIGAALESVDLTFKRDAFCGTLSRGMKQRLVLAKTLLHDPKVLLLDEPASGLDPMARIELRELLKAQAVRGKTVLISSHILTELQGFCTSIGIMEKGVLRASGPIRDIAAGFRPHKRVVVELLEQRADAAQVATALAGVRVAGESNGGLELDVEGDDAAVVALLRHLMDAHLPVKGFWEQEMGVEDILLQVGAKEVT